MSKKRASVVFMVDNCVLLFILRFEALVNTHSPAATVSSSDSL